MCTSLVSAMVFVSWFSFWHRTKLARNEKERAYVCTLLSSSITSTCSLPLVYELLSNGGDLSALLVYRTWTVVATTFFMTFLIMDLCIGVFFYKNKIDMLTGWIHHLTYLITLTWAIHHQYSAVFIMMCVLEIPTFVLALGSVRSHLRRDYVFAGTFLLTRILFHAYAISCAWKLNPFGPVVNALTFFFPVHCFWFYGFIKQQIRLMKTDPKITPTRTAPKKKQESVTQKPIKTTTTIMMKKKKSPISEPRRRTNYSSYTTPSFHQSPPVSVH
ncbi:uncharacterized protein EV154DRAFT_488575 [Mucor mucedo]|uniref:uncharacterized protein n=1 Tax=Mucor mucedo TaxID=29922 RepID=UPI00221F2F37|nr:uncharacterized protein EV154DRAFT_488575 [Mucor mucedo]KAI7866308.1 hypothetical protein EV154DRAFT_488575 [Mucor mucedo]